MNTRETSLVVKSNALVEAMTDMGLQEMRFLAFAASQLPRDLPPEMVGPYDMEIDVQTLARTFEIEEKSAYREIKALADRLMRKIIQFDDDDGCEVAVGLISRRKYHRGEGRLWFRFDEAILPHLMGLTERFTAYRIKDVYQFSRPATWRVYELLKQFKEIGKREIDVEDLRWKLGLVGKYAVVGNLKARVIDPAIEEINGTSDLLVGYDQKKRGRRVTGFIFVIRDNLSTKTPREKIRAVAEKLDTGKSFCPDLEAELRDVYGVSAKQARQLANLAKGRESEVTARLPRITARYDGLETKKTSLGGYVFRAVKAELATPKQGTLPLATP